MDNQRPNYSRTATGLYQFARDLIVSRPAHHIRPRTTLNDKWVCECLSITLTQLDAFKVAVRETGRMRVRRAENSYGKSTTYTLTHA